MQAGWLAWLPDEDHGMRLAGTTWPTQVNSVHLGDDTYRVIRPAMPIRATLADTRYSFELQVQRDDAALIAHAWQHAQYSPRSLVYLPLRDGGWAGESTVPVEHQLDLVLTHHQIQFAPANWKAVRARLRQTGRPHTVQYRPAGPVDYDRIWYRENLDHLGWTVQASTLFITGSHAAFATAEPEMRTFAESAPEKLAAEPDWHHCAEIALGTPRVQRGRNFGELHVVAL